MALGPGSIAFTGFNADGNDNLAFLVTEDIPAGTEIHFSTRSYNGAFRPGQGDFATWTADDEVPAGTVITLDDLATTTPSASSGSIAFAAGSTTMDISTFRESVLAYTGSDATTPDSFLAGIAKETALQAGVSMQATGLEIGQTFVELNQIEGISRFGPDIAVFDGSSEGRADFADYLPFINNGASWIGQSDGSIDNSNDGIAPDAPFDTTPFTVDPTAQTLSFAPESLAQEIVEGDEGTSALSFVVQRTGGTDGDLTFSGMIDFGGMDANDFGGTLPTFSGTIPAGQDSVVVTIEVSGDTTFEPEESFQVVLDSASNPEAGVVLGSETEATATVLDDNDPQPGVVATGETFERTFSLTGDQTLTVEEGGKISVGEGVSEGHAIVFPDNLSTGVVIDNAGEIEAFREAIVADFRGNDHEITIINRQTGVIRSEDRTAIELEADRPDAGEPAISHVVLDNAGLIAGEKAVDFRKLYSESVTIINRETGVMTSTTGDVLRPGNGTIETVLVQNYGQIVDGLGSDAIDFQDGSAGTVENFSTGLIQGGRHGITGDVPIVVTNAEGGVIKGLNGSGINMDTRPDAGPTTVTNHGLISGDSADGDSDGIDVDGILHLENYGRVEAIKANNVSEFAEGLAIGGGIVNNYEGGEIFGESNGIRVDGSDNDPAFAAVEIYNEGSITATLNEAIKFVGDFDDQVINSGVIATDASSGIAIDMGGGNDLLKVTGEGAIEGQALGGAGDDTLEGGSAEDDFHGGEGDDQLDGGFGEDTLTGGEGDDTLEGGFGDDSLDGGEGDDDLAGGWGDDAVIGSEGEDLIEGGWDDDMLVGGEGDDFLIGGWGDDTLEGGAGDDRLEGKRGNDAFLFRGEFGDDLIVDYDEGEVIILEGYGLAFEELAISETDEGTLVAVEGGGSIFVEDTFNLGQDSFQLI